MTHCLQAVQACDSQFDWVEVFPLIGDGVYVHRTNGSMINPFLVGVKAVGRVAQALDSQALIHLGNTISVSMGEDVTETLNAIIPLFDEADVCLAPLVSSELFKLLVHFQIMGNVDTYDSNSYLAALASLWCHFVTLPDSTFRNERMHRVLATVKLAYGGNKGWNTYLDLVRKCDRTALITDHATAVVKCESLSKVMLAQAYIAAELQPDAAFTWGSSIVTEFLGRAVPADKEFGTFFTRDFTADNVFEDQVVADISPGPYRLLREMHEAAMAVVRTRTVTADDAELCMDRVRSLSYFNVSYSTLLACLAQLFGAVVADRVLEVSNLTKLLYTATKHSNSLERNTVNIAEVATDEAIQRTLSASFAALLQRHFASNGCSRLTAAFRVRFMAQHDDILPLTRQQLIAMCRERGIDHTQLQRSRSGERAPIYARMCVECVIHALFRTAPQCMCSAQLPPLPAAMH